MDTINRIHEWILSLTDNQYAILVLFCTWVVASISGFIIGRLSKRRLTPLQEGIEKGFNNAKEFFDAAADLLQKEANRTIALVREQCDEKIAQHLLEYEAAKRELKRELEQQAIAHGAGTYRQLDENDEDDESLMDLLDAEHGDTVFVWRDQLTQDQRQGLFTFQTRTTTYRPRATAQPARPEKPKGSYGGDIAQSNAYREADKNELTFDLDTSSDEDHDQDSAMNLNL